MVAKTTLCALQLDYYQLLTFLSVDHINKGQMVSEIHIGGH